MSDFFFFSLHIHFLTKKKRFSSGPHVILMPLGNSQSIQPLQCGKPLKARKKYILRKDTIRYQ